MPTAYEAIVRGEVIPGIEARQHPRLPPHRPDAPRPRRRGRIPDLDVVRRPGRRSGPSSARIMRSATSRPPRRRCWPASIGAPRIIEVLDRRAASSALSQQRVPDHPPRPHRFPQLCGRADRAGAGLRPAVGRQWRGQDQRARSGVAADSGPRAARRGAERDGAERRAGRFRRVGVSSLDGETRASAPARSPPRPTAARSASTARRPRSMRSPNGCRCCG